MSQIESEPRRIPRKKLSRKNAKLIAAAAAAVSFSVPWIAFKVAPAPMASGNQVVVVPAGSRVTVIKPVSGAPNVTVLTSKGAPTTASAPVAATTGASAVPKP
jgi:4-hydroxybenzoate polyprenyltransferase